MQRLSRYVELVRRVAQINRKYGKKQRANELESLADRVAMAQVGRDPKPEPTSDTPAQNIMFDSGAGMLKYIVQLKDASDRESMLKALLQVSNPTASPRSSLPDGMNI